MKFGIGTFVTDEGISPTDLGCAIEERGFESLLVAEHTHIPTSRESPYPGGGELPRVYYRTLDPFVTLTAVAAVTERVLVGTGIALMIQRDPIVTAKEVASLDLISNGRVIFGVGAGWNREEMRDHGTDPSTRGTLLDERMKAILELWAKDEAEFHGEFVTIEPSYAWPKPVQRPHPPIYVGGNSPATFRRIAEYGQGWLSNALPVGEMATQIAKLRQKAGRDVPVSVWGAPADAELLSAYGELGIERVCLLLETRPKDETLKELDALAEVVAALG